MENRQARPAAGLCPPGLEDLRTGVIGCLPDDALTFLWGNAAFFRMSGYTAEGFHRLFGSLRQFFAPLPGQFEAVRRGAAAGSDFELTVRLPRQAGGFSWARLLGRPVRVPGMGAPVLQAELAPLDDPAVEEEAQARLIREQRHAFRAVLDAYEGNCYVSDMDTYELLYVNKSSCAVLGRPASKLVGRKCYEVIQGRSSPCPFCTNEKLSRDRFYCWQFDNPVLKRTFMIQNLMIDWEGRRARLELSRDSFSAEYKLAKKDQERDALINSLRGGFARMDARDMTTVLWYGGGFLDMIGYTREQFEGELGSRSLYIHPEDADHAAEAMDQARQTGEATAVEGRVVTRDGTVKLLTITYSYVDGADSWDGIPSFYSVGLDVTKERQEQARQRQALEDACRAAQIASDAKTNFLSSMSHDIRTPMNAIIGMSAIAQANLHSPEKIQDCLGKINTASRHLLDLIDEVLDMSKIESGKIDLEPGEVFLPDLIEEVADVFRPLAVEKRQQLQVNADRVRHETVVTDGGRLRQILVNLLSNAIKYTPDGGAVGLRVQEAPSFVTGKGQYSFLVTDTGIGMRKEFIPHLFEPFTRADEVKSRNIQGTGLGMAITQNIVRMMNGTIEVKSAPGEGTQFLVAMSFPLCGEEDRGGENLAGLSVLVADGDQAVCESAAEILSELGMRSSRANSGREAVRLVAERHGAGDNFFAVLLDGRISDPDGPETLRLIRQAAGGPAPVVIVTAHDCAEIGESFRRAGADALLSKPLFQSKMLRALGGFCRRGRHSDQAAAPAATHGGVAGKRVLLVEDNALNREIAVELLEMYGLTVDTAENGQVAVERFAASAPGAYACILMDIQMPVMDGYSASRSIRALEREDARSIPILALTANAFAADAGRARNAGMNDHVTKPIDIDRLLETLQRWIGRPHV